MYECETPFHLKVWYTVVFTCAVLFAVLLAFMPVMFAERMYVEKLEKKNGINMKIITWTRHR